MDYQPFLGIHRIYKFKQNLHSTYKDSLDKKNKKGIFERKKKPSKRMIASLLNRHNT